MVHTNVAKGRNPTKEGRGKLFRQKDTFKPIESISPKPISLKRAVCFGLCIWAFMTFFLWRRYRLTFEMNDEQQPLTLFSENALYYSFYLDVVRAPSVVHAVDALMHDKRSEHPTVINAIERFNIYPELLVGLVYRCLRYFLQDNLEAWVRTPFNFYATSIFCFQGFGVACVCVLASIVGSSFFCGICCFGFFWGNFYHRLILRTDALALREHWGLPFLWMNIIAIYIMLQRHMRLRDQGKILAPLLTAVLTAIGLLLAWQFGVFILTTQIAALFGMCLLGYPLSIVIRRIVAFYIFSLVIVFVFMFAPKYLALSFFPHVAVSVFFSLWWFPRYTTKPRSFSGWLLGVDFWRGLVAVGLLGVIRCALLPFDKDDAHVFKLLLYHLGLSKDTFDSTIYILGQTEFLPLNSTLANHMRLSGVLFVAGAMAVVLLVFVASEIVLVHRLTCKNWDLFMRFDEGLLSVADFRGHRKEKVEPTDATGLDKHSSERLKLEPLVGGALTQRKPAKPVQPSIPTVAHSEDFEEGYDVQTISALSPGLCFLFLQAFCFTALMLLIARLRILALPLLCVMASLIASAGVWRSCTERLLSASGIRSALSRSVGGRTKRLFKIVAFFLLAALSLMPFFIKLPLTEMLTPFPALENSSSTSKQRLFEWLAKNIPADSGIMGDMTTSAAIRAALPSMRIVVHPQYENVGIRRRVQFSYGTAACPPMAVYNQQLRDVYKVDYIIQSSFRCAVAPNSPTSVFDVADKIDEFQFQCPLGVSLEQRFCFRTLFDNNRFFDIVYANEVFSVLKRVESPLVNQQAATVKGMPSEYESFNWKDKILDKSSWRPWIDRCSKNDPHCGANIAGVGMRMLERYNLTDVATFLHSLAAKEFSDPETMEEYALYLDFNLHTPAAAEKYYRIAASVQPPSLSRAVQYALYFQEHAKTQTQFVEAARKIVTAIKALNRPTAELLGEVDNICRGAVLLQLLANNMRSPMTGDERRQFTEAAQVLWMKAQEVNIQNSCVVQHWQLFEGESLSTAKRIVHFFVGSLHARKND